MARVAIDICNTIVDINSKIEEKGYRRNRGAYFYLGLPNDFFVKHLEVFRDAKPINGAVEALHRLVEAGNEIVYLTARPEVAKEVTLWNLFEKNGFPKGEVVHSFNKASDFKRLNCDYAIDDAPAEIENYRENGCEVIIFATDYNSRFAGYRITGWDNFAQKEEQVSALRCFY